MIRPALTPALTPVLTLVLALAAAPAGAQNRPTTDILPGTRAETVAPLIEGEIARGKGALLRGLDKVSGQSTDLPVDVGQAVTFGRLEVRLGECRYPAADKESDAFAEMTITDTQHNRTLFTGWMIASSPALSALDDARYDVWVVACNDGTGAARPDMTYVPDTAVPEGGEGAGPDGEGAPPTEGTGGEGEGETPPEDGVPADTGDAPADGG